MIHQSPAGGRSGENEVSLQSFFELLEREEVSVFPTEHLAARLGREVFSALERVQILVRAEPRTYPGGGTGSGMAGDPHAADLTSVSKLRLARMVQELLGPTLTSDVRRQVPYNFFTLGLGTWGTRERMIFLLFNPEVLPKLFDVRVDAYHGSLMLVPTRRGVPGSFALQDYSARLELMFLEDIMSVEDGRLCLDRSKVITSLSPPAMSGEPMFQILDRGGMRYVGELQARQLATRAADLDLWIDMTNALEAGRFRAGRRLLDGTHEEVVLPRNHAAAIAELAECRLALQPRDFVSIELVDAARVVQRARRAVDVRLSRYTWRSIHTLRGETPGAKRYLFNPPQDLLFAILKPIAVDTKNRGEKENTR